MFFVKQMTRRNKNLTVVGDSDWAMRTLILTNIVFPFTIITLAVRPEQKVEFSPKISWTRKTIWPLTFSLTLAPIYWSKNRIQSPLPKSYWLIYNKEKLLLKDLGTRRNKKKKTQNKNDYRTVFENRNIFLHDVFLVNYFTIF